MLAQIYYYFFGLVAISGGAMRASARCGIDHESGRRRCQSSSGPAPGARQRCC